MKPILLFAVLLASVAALPQAAPPSASAAPTIVYDQGGFTTDPNNKLAIPKLMANWPQLKRLREKQKRFIDESIKLNTAMKALLDECQRTVAENNWPAETTCDLRDLTFTPAVVYNSPPRK